MARTIYQNYIQSEQDKFAQMSEESLQDLAEEQAKSVQDREMQTSEDNLAQVSSPQAAMAQRRMGTAMNVTNPMALSPEQLLAVKAMNQRNNANYLYEIAKKAREGGNIADSGKYSQFAKQFTKNAATLDRDALLSRREILADDAILLSSIKDQPSLNNAVSLAELRGRPMSELMTMTDEGVYSGKTQNYIESRLGQINQERDWLDVNTQVLDDETRYFDRLSDDKRAIAFDRHLARKEALAQQNLVKEERDRQRQEAKLQRDALKDVPRSYGDLLSMQKKALRKTPTDKQLDELDRINPELAAIERNRRDVVADPMKFAKSLGYDLNLTTGQVRDQGEAARERVTALPPAEILRQEWVDAKKKVLSEEQLNLLRAHKDPLYGVYAKQAEQVDTISKFVKSKYGVTITPEDMMDPMDRTIFTDDTGQQVTPRALIETAANNRMTVDQVLRDLGMAYEDREKVLEKYPQLKGQL